MTASASPLPIISARLSIPSRRWSFSGGRSHVGRGLGERGGNVGYVHDFLSDHRSSPDTSKEPSSTRTASNSLRTLLRRSIWAARRLQTSRMGSHHVGNEQSPTKSLLRKPHATGRGSRRPRPPFPGSKQPGFEISSRLKKKRKPWIVKRLCRRTAGGSLKTGADEMMTTLADIQDSKTPRLQDS